MRVIGNLQQEGPARAFADYLYSQGIACRVEYQEGEHWLVWVEDEDKLEEARVALENFRQNPKDRRFVEAGSAAEKRKKDKAKEEAKYRERLRNRTHVFKPLTGYGFGPFTFVLIGISVFVFILSNFGRAHEPVMGLYITRFWEQGSSIAFFKSLPEVRSGQLWRLITPIFMHGDVFHILFNMLWLRDLGSMIEGRQSWRVLLALVLVSAVLSNLGQFYLGGAPNFCGMSGVVYGLLGYVWMRGKFDPASGLVLHPTTVTLMVVWYVACLIGLIPNIANWAHTVGFAIGIGWGYISATRAHLHPRP